MKPKDQELKEIFLAEALENYEELNRLFTALEKDHSNIDAVEAVFRITHTLKANAAAMGFEAIASLSHLLEDIFSEIKSQKMHLTTAIFNDLFRANDKLGDLIDAIKTEESIPYKGMMAKLKVILRKARGEEQTPPPKTPPAEASTIEPKIQGIESAEGQKEELENTAQQAEPENDNPEPASPRITFSDLVQVPVSKLDNLLNLVSELAIEKDRIIAENQQTGRLGSGNEFARLYRITSDLQYSVMEVRLVQVSVLFNKFHRIVRDVAVLENKKVDLVLEGTDIEIDRNILQIISDSMIHLVRNGVSHGIETAQERKVLGKPEVGVLKLSAHNDKDHVVIDISDDGRGMDAAKIRQKVIEKNLLPAEFAQKLTNEDILKYIFEPGFSMAKNVTQISGRGVGMDVVKKAIDSIGGKINIKTTLGKGTTFSMVLPSSMAVKSVLLFVLGQSEFAIPLPFTEAVISVRKKDIHKVGEGLVATHLEEPVSVVYLNDIFGAKQAANLYQPKLLHQTYDKQSANEKINIIVVAVDRMKVGFVVDRLLQQKEIIEKPLKKPVENTMFISGATILGNGNVCLVIDVPSIVDYLYKIVNGLNPIQENYKVLA